MLFGSWSNVVAVVFGALFALAILAFVYATCVYLYENTRRRKYGPRR